MPPKKTNYRDFPFDEICAAVKEKLAQGFEVYQKFSCAGCGNRLTMPDNGVIYETGTCDKCATVTNIRQRGCNYMLVATHGTSVQDIIKQAVKEEEDAKRKH